MEQMLDERWQQQVLPALPVYKRTRDERCDGPASLCQTPTIRPLQRVRIIVRNKRPSYPGTSWLAVVIVMVAVCFTVNRQRTVQSFSPILGSCPIRSLRLGMTFPYSDVNESSQTSAASSSASASASLERTAAHLEKLRLQSHTRRRKRNSVDTTLASAASAARTAQASAAALMSRIPDPLGEERERLVQDYLLQPALELKRLLQQRQMAVKGRKPDLARRLAQDDLVVKYGMDNAKEYRDHLDDGDDERLVNGSHAVDNDARKTVAAAKPVVVVTSFAGLSPLSTAAATALTRAKFHTPSLIQAQAIPWIARAAAANAISAGSSRKQKQSQPQASVPSSSSCILHAATGSGKTLAYLLPITERLWMEPADSDCMAMILTPTRELAAQVAGIAQVLAPPGTVRLVSRPMDLTARLPVERSQLLGGQNSDSGRGNDYDRTVNVQPRIFVGSATALQYSLYGDNGRQLPASPTTKPEAMWILQNTAYLVLDEVDRLLNVVGGGNSGKSVGQHAQSGSGKRVKKTKASRSDDVSESPPPPPEMAAAILTAAVTRLTLGKATIVAVSATVGRPLRRELARCMGLTPQECPPTLRDDSDDANTDTGADDDTNAATNHKTTNPETVAVGSDETIPNAASSKSEATTTTRAVTIPDTVQHFVLPVLDGTSPGKILTTAFTAIQSLSATATSTQPTRQPRILLVLARNFGISVPNAIGALKHFKCQPEPVSLLDALEADGTQAMMDVHRQVTGAGGVGSSLSSSDYFDVPLDSSTPEAQPTTASRPTKREGYLYVTGEDSVRGLHLDGLDVVMVAGRPVGPDEYTHIAGRTGRAGLSGSVVNIVSDQDVGKVLAWEKMLGIRFDQCESAKELGAVVSANTR